MMEERSQILIFREQMKQCQINGLIVDNERHPNQWQDQLIFEESFQLCERERYIVVVSVLSREVVSSRFFMQTY